MLKCPKCGRWNSLTNDLKCAYCGQQITGGDKEQQKLIKNWKKALDDIDQSIKLLKQIGRTQSISGEIQYSVQKIRHLNFILGLLSLVYLLIFACLEFTTFYVSVPIGILYSCIVLFAIIINASISPFTTHRDFLLALCLIPLLRTVSSVVPVSEIPEIYRYIVIAITIFAGVIAVSRNSGYSLDDIGLSCKKPVIQVLIALLGIGLGILDYFIFRPESLISTLTVQTVILPAFILVLAKGFLVELIFRGVLQRSASALGSWGWVYVAAVYTIGQIGQKSIYHGIFTLLVSLLFGWVVKKTGSIVGVSVSQGLISVALYLILPHMGLNLPFFSIL